MTDGEDLEIIEDGRETSDGSDDGRPPTEKFELTRSNAVLIFIVLGIFGVIGALSGRGVAFAVGQAFGGFLFIMLVASLAAWTVWRLSNRDRDAGSIAFNVTVVGVLASVVLVPLLKAGNAARQRVAELKMQEVQERLQDEDLTPEELTQARNELRSRMASSGSDLDREVIRRVQPVLDREQRLIDRFFETFDAAFENETLLDYEYLSSRPEERDERRKLFRAFGEAADEVVDFTRSRPAIVREAFAGLDEEAPEVAKFLAAIDEVQREQYLPALPYYEAGRDVGMTGAELLGMLADGGRWDAEAEWVSFEDAARSEAFDRLDEKNTAAIDAFNAAADAIAE